MPANATFTKEERICSVKEIEAIIHQGKSLFHYPFKVNYKIDLIPGDAQQPPQSSSLKAAILVSVPKRNFKRAVKRNLLKRRIRESYRLNKELLQLPQKTRIAIMFVYVSKEIISSAGIETKIREILGKLNTAAEKSETIA